MKRLLNLFFKTCLFLLLFIAVCAIAFALCDDFVIGTYLALFTWAVLTELAVLYLAKSGHPQLILWIRQSKTEDFAAYCSKLHRPTLCMMSIIASICVVAFYVYILGSIQLVLPVTILCTVGYLIYLWILDKRISDIEIK